MQGDRRVPMSKATNVNTGLGRVYPFLTLPVATVTPSTPLRGKTHHSELFHFGPHKRLFSPPSRPPSATWRVQAALQAQLGASWAPLGSSNWPPSATWRLLGATWCLLGATWCFLARFLVLLQPSESSSRLHESSILMFLHFCLSRLPFEPLGRVLGSTCGLLGASWTQLEAS